MSESPSRGQDEPKLSPYPATVFCRLRLPRKNSSQPNPTIKTVAPTILTTARNLFGSSGEGITEKRIVESVVRKPTLATNLATGRPPGTRKPSIGAGRAWTLNIEAK